MTAPPTPRFASNRYRSVYVRLGMHLLYYGSQQEKLLHTQRALKLLEEQSTKMGLQYDDPKSVDHIIPFVRRLTVEHGVISKVQTSGVFVLEYRPL